MARWTLGGSLAMLVGLAASAETLAPMPQDAGLRPQARSVFHVPEALWDGESQAKTWSVAAMRAVASAPQDLREVVPADIDAWCPGYESNPPHLRAAFWVGTVSALAKRESGFDEGAVGGGGSWHGLMQISPATARGNGCQATSGEALRDGEANLACAVRIIARTVSRDGVVADGGGIAADWGPMARQGPREEMRAWVREQPYCAATTAVMASLRPVARPGAPIMLASLAD